MSLLAQEKLMIRPKVVVALYPFKAIEGDDLSLERVSHLFGLFCSKIFILIFHREPSTKF